MKPDDISREDIDTDVDWETLDSQVYTVLQDTQAALEEALVATQKLSQWVERLHTLSAFMRQVETGLAEVRHQLKGPPEALPSEPVPPMAPRAETVEVSEPPMAPRAETVEVSEPPWSPRAETVEVSEPPMAPRAETAEVSEPPWALAPSDAEAEVDEEPVLTALEAQEAESGPEPSEATAMAEVEESLWPAEAEVEEALRPAEAGVEEPLPPAEAEVEESLRPAEGEPPERAPSVTEVGGSIRLQIESSEANIDLMVVERALRETPGVADVDLLDYAGKRARVQVTFSGRERHQEVADPEHLAANVQERLTKLTWDASLSVSPTE
jgi:hypothetical protein